MTTSTNWLQRSFAVALMVLIGFAMQPRHAHALAVFDGANFGRNALTAMQTARVYSQEVMQYSLQIRQYLNMLQMAKSLNPALIEAGLARGALPAGFSGTLGDAQASAQGVYGTSQNVHALMEDVGKTFGQSIDFSNGMNRMSISTGKSWQQIIDGEIESARQGKMYDAKMFQAAQGLNQQMQQHKARSDALAGQLRTNDSLLGAVTTVGGSLNLMSDQMSSLIQTSNMQLQRQLMRDIKEQDKTDYDKVDRKERHQKSIDMWQSLKQGAQPQ